MDIFPDHLGGHNRWTSTQVELEGTSYPVPTAPGLGIEVDEKVVSGQRHRFWEAPHLHRRDGSYTNN